jgi:hypothetical protein
MKKQYLPKQTTEQVDNLYKKLKKYHDEMLGKLDNVTTVKLAPEVVDVLKDVSRIDDGTRNFSWSKEDEQRLNRLNEQVKELKVREDWSWRSDSSYFRSEYNDRRMQFCVEKEMVYKIIQCPQCQSTGLLVGLDQIDSELCFDCIMLNNFRVSQREKIEAWNKVRPHSQEFPKRTESGHEHEDLPQLFPGDKAVIAPVQPIVTIKQNHYANKRLRQESISIQQDPAPTWCRILPRSDLKNRFMVIDRTTKHHVGKKYIVASSQRVLQWLRYLFKNHKEFIQMRANNELELSMDAVKALDSQTELAEVLNDMDVDEITEENAVHITQAEMESGLTCTDVFCFDKYPNLYLRAKEFMKVRARGKIEIVENVNAERRITYNSSANMSFPHLFPNGEMSPLDFHAYKLARYL